MNFLAENSDDEDLIVEVGYYIRANKFSGKQVPIWLIVELAKKLAKYSPEVSDVFKKFAAGFKP